MGGKPTDLMYTTSIAMRGHENKTGTKDTTSLDYIGSRIGWVSMKEIYLSLV